MKKFFLAWEDDTSIRSRVLAAQLNAEYRAFTHFDQSKYFHWLRYPVASAQTLWTLARHRPQLLFVQNPSILLAFEAALLKPVFGYRLVIDLHTPFSRPTGLRKRVIDFLHLFGLRHCDAVVVTNEQLRKRVMQQTPQPVFVLPDKVPELRPAAKSAQLSAKFNVLYICTFSEDEPWREVLKAGEALPDDVRIYVSGRTPLRPEDVPANVTLTGYLSRQDYESLLASVDAVMVLTTVEENLVCGGYEAVAAGKPLLISNTRALRALYKQGTVFTDNNAHAIAQAITQIRQSLPKLAAGAALQKQLMDADWQRLWQKLMTHVGVTKRSVVSGMRVGAAG